MGYKSDGAAYDMVCAAIGWDARVHAIQVMPRGSSVYVTGTLLKPHEWRALSSHDGDPLPDGRRIKITHLPRL